MNAKESLLEWKKFFVMRIADRVDRPILENRFEERINSLSEEETQKALDYLLLWKSCATDSEKFYFSKKIVDIILQKK